VSDTTPLGADEDGARAGDALPSDLDVTAYVGPYQFPGTHRRRIAGVGYVLFAVASAVGTAASGNSGLAAAAALLGLIGVVHQLAAWRLRVDQTEALVIATRAVGFPVGHASGQLGFRGLRSRPSWRILCYSADEPPSVRGLVELDAVDGTVIGQYTERNPEDWSQYGLGEGPDRRAH
jgi:hypothetical protein